MVEHQRHHMRADGDQAERRQEPVESKLRCRWLPDAAAEADPPGHDQRVAGERDERAGAGDLPGDHRRASRSQRGGVRTSSPTITIAASGSSATRCGRSASVLASTSAETGSSATTVACAATPGSPVTGSIRWCANCPSPLRHERRVEPGRRHALPFGQPQAGDRRRSTSAEGSFDVDHVVATHRDQVAAGVDEHRRRRRTACAGAAPPGRPSIPWRSRPDRATCLRGPAPGRGSAVDRDGAAHRAPRRARRGVRPVVGRLPVIPPGRQRASDQRLEHAVGAAHPAVTCVEQIERLLRHLDLVARRSVEAADLAVREEARPASLVPLSQHGRGRRLRRDAAGVVDLPGRAGGRPPPGRVGGRRAGHGAHQLVLVVGAALTGAGAGTGTLLEAGAYTVPPETVR